MDQAVAAVIGVGVGAFMTGGVGAFFGWLGRRNAARTGALLVITELRVARAMMAGSKAVGGWWHAQFPIPNADWDRYREAVASVASAEDFQTISAAYIDLAWFSTIRTNAAREDADRETELFMQSKTLLDSAIDKIDQALLVVDRLSRNLWERSWRPK